MQIDRQLLSRKFVLAVVAFSAGIGVLAFGAIDGLTWVSYSQWVVGLYMAGNVGATVATKMNENPTEKV
jgi:hypothetical protein